MQRRRWRRIPPHRKSRCSRSAEWSTRTAPERPMWTPSCSGSTRSRARAMRRPFARNTSCGRFQRASTGSSRRPKPTSRTSTSLQCVPITSAIARCPCAAVYCVSSDSGNFDRATILLKSARSLATRLGDEAALVETEERVSDIADRRGDRAEERRGSLAGLEHAKRSGSGKWLELALLNLGDSYLKTRDFTESLNYSKQALPIMLRAGHHEGEQIALFNEGLANIGLGSVKAGEKLAEGAIDKALGGSDLVGAKDLLREHAAALDDAA